MRRMENKGHENMPPPANVHEHVNHQSVLEACKLQDQESIIRELGAYDDLRLWYKGASGDSGHDVTPTAGTVGLVLV